MMSVNPGKIVLKSSTKVSLNDRFSNIMKMRSTSTSAITARVANDRMASERNRRLAQQMERRPSVAAELMNRPVRVSVKDRLGSVPFRGGFTRGRQPLRGGRFQTRGWISPRGVRRPGRGVRGQTTYGRRGFSFRGFRGGRGGYTRGGYTRGGYTRGGYTRGGYTRGGYTRGGYTRGGTYTRGRGRGRGGRQPRGAMTRRPAPNKDTLDQQLDGYMTRAKSAMNSDLDSYMADRNE